MVKIHKEESRQINIMPFGTGYQNVGAYKRYYKKKPKTKKHIVKAVEKKVDKLNKIVKQEYKYSDFSTVIQAFNDESKEVQVNFAFGIPQGTTNFTRIGTKIQPKYIEFKYYLVQNDIATDTLATFTRVVLLRDDFPNQKLLELSQVWDKNPGTTDRYMSPETLRNEQYKKRIHILHDRTHTLGGGGLGTSTATAIRDNIPVLRIPVHRRIKQSKPMIYLAGNSGGQYTDMTNGAYYFCVWGSYDPRPPQVVIWARLYYTDS